LLVLGAGGAGKTHLFCDVAYDRAVRKLPVLLYLGQQLHAANPWPQLWGRTGLSFEGREEFLGALNTAGELAGCRALVLLDALNEVIDDPGLWRDEVPGMLRVLQSYPHVGVAFSLRDSYLRHVVPAELDEIRLPRVTHHGFSEVVAEATARFFEHYRLQIPDTPLLDPEFSNPLFLKLFCEAYSPGCTPATEPSPVPAGAEGFSGVFTTYLERVDDKLVRDLKLDRDEHDRPVLAVVDRLADVMAERGETAVPRSEAVDIVRGILRSSKAVSILGRLVEEGLLARDVRYNSAADRGTEVVRFGYDRFAAHLVVRRLLDTHVSGGQVRQAFRRNTPLKALVRDPSACARNASAVDALLLQLPERFGVELLDLIPGTVQATWHVRRAFFQTIAWRAASAVTERTVDLVRQILETGSSFCGDWLTALVTLAVRPRHRLNATAYLHERLMQVPMPERDAAWTLRIPELLADGGPLERIVDWPHRQPPTPRTDAQMLELGAVLISWCFTSTNRPFRDRATKALVRLLQDRLDIVERLVDRFRGVNDPYVLERVLAAAYGCCLRTSDGPGLERLARSAFSWFFAGGRPPVCVLTRDYARGIVELAGHRGLIAGLDLALARPPYTSDWIKPPPTWDELRQQHQPDAAQKRRGLASILHSVEGYHGIGDFGVYRIGRDWSQYWRRGTARPPRRSRETHMPFDGDLPHRWIFQRVMQLGWASDLFEGNDGYTRWEGRGRPRIERIGKKYQWIALREFQARLNDNFELDESWGNGQRIPYLGPWQLHARDVDPSLLLRRTQAAWTVEAACWWCPVSYRSFEREPDYSRWLRGAQDLPDPAQFLVVQEPGTSQCWLLLGGRFHWREHPPGEENRSFRPFRELAYIFDAFAVRKKDLRKFLAWSGKTNFFERRMPGPLDCTHPFWGEQHWAPACRLNDPRYYGDELWTQPAVGQNPEVLPCPVVPLNAVYSWSDDEADASLEEAVRISVPALWW
jgi:hypothetical protein